jgi:hypothetical protein
VKVACIWFILFVSKNQNVPLDYWIHLDVTEYQNADEWIAQIQDVPVFS